LFLSRIENLQLLEAYGAHGWGQSNKHLENVRDKYANTEIVRKPFLITSFSTQRIIKSLDEVRLKTQDVNRKRKHHQLEAAEKLAELNQRWHELVQKNIEISSACVQLQEEIQSSEQKKQVAALWSGKGYDDDEEIPVQIEHEDEKESVTDEVMQE
jgi:hypothetical protein